MNLSNVISLSNAITVLMKPLVEVAIHDLTTGKICHIAGDISGRKIGDPSLLDPNDLETGLHEITYPKLNFDGKLIKSISVPIDERWLVCINCDVSIFNAMKGLGAQLLASHHGEMPSSLFKNDWQERLHIALHGFIKEKGWRFSELTARQKKEVIHFLFLSGAFLEKNAADYVARILVVGRATVFNYLKEWRKS